MIPIARLTDQHACPIPFHVLTPLVTASPTAYVNGIPIARVGDMSGCGAVIVSGFPHILVNGRPMAHVGSLTSHGGSIVTGSHDCVGGEVNFTTSKLVVDFGRLGAVREDGSVDEALMAELLSDSKLEERARAAGALVQTNDAPFSAAVFDPAAKITSFACRTGMGNPQDLEIEGAVQLDPQSESSLAQKLANYLKVPVHAFLTRSDYRNTWGSFRDRREGKLCEITSENLPSEEWCAEWQGAMEEREKDEGQIAPTYQRSGAIRPVEPGNTPFGPTWGLIEFKPDV